MGRWWLLWLLVIALGLGAIGLSLMGVKKELQMHEWWRDAVFYEVFVRSFYDSDGDGIGDLRGLQRKLDYLEWLGISALWLMPIFPSPSYHGYDVTDYFSVNPDYGTLEDFKALLKEAHRRGLRIILDLPINHTSDKHPWFQAAVHDPDSPYRSYYLWSETDPGYLSPMGGPAWHPSPTGYYYAAFWSGMPDLNLENPQVIEEIHKIVRFWLVDVGVDGFRLDAVKHLIEEGPKQENTESTHRWLRAFYGFVKELKPEALLVGEVWSPIREVARYIQNDELDLAFEFDTAAALVRAAREGLAEPARRAHALDRFYYPDERFATFLANHDQDRVMSQLGGDWNKAKMAASLLLMGPGVPFLYYGEEIGLQGTKPDEDIRRPMQWDMSPNAGFTTGKPWRPPFGQTVTISVAAQQDNPNSLLSHYRRLIQLRREHEALRVGAYLKVKVEGSAARSVYAFVRQSKEETLLVVMNLGEAPVRDYSLTLQEGQVPGGQAAIELLQQTAVVAPSLNEQGRFTGYRPLHELPPYSTFIVCLK